MQTPVPGKEYRHKAPPTPYARMDFSALRGSLRSGVGSREAYGFERGPVQEEEAGFCQAPPASALGKWHNTLLISTPPERARGGHSPAQAAGQECGPGLGGWRWAEAMTQDWWNGPSISHPPPSIWACVGADSVPPWAILG